MKTIPTPILCCMASLLVGRPIHAFKTVFDPSRTTMATAPSRNAAAPIVVVGHRRSDYAAAVACPTPLSPPHRRPSSSSTRLYAVTPDLGMVALVAGQENYGLAVVSLMEAIWSFAQSPSMTNARVLLPASIASIVLIALSGPMITSGNVDSVTLGLEIAAVVSIFLGASYVARLLAPYSPSAKEAAFAGLLIAIAGFFSFSQNLVVDGFVTLPTLPSLPLPEMPLGLGESIDTDRY
ncbi:hypothetical protein ACHAXA_009270 [Cyclostephanos tholiformis]|uniref:EamA domain-containing protein n=1 Tax=Cyclostephanos tholiformis TaxID=382380 RepID=A0ABD3RE25_9STRA